MTSAESLTPSQAVDQHLQEFDQQLTRIHDLTTKLHASKDYGEKLKYAGELTILYHTLPFVAVAVQKAIHDWAAQVHGILLMQSLMAVGVRDAVIEGFSQN